MLSQPLTAFALILLNSAAAPAPPAGEVHQRASLGEVGALAYSPDGRTLASGSGDDAGKGLLVLWDVPSGKPRVWLPQMGRVCKVAFSPNGEKLAAACGDGKVRIYEARTAKLLAALKGHGEGADCVAFSPDGKTLASGSFDKTVILWDAIKLTELRRLTGHEGWVHGVAFFPDGKSLASVSNDFTVRVWDVETGKERQTLKDPTLKVGYQSVAVSPDGKTIAAGCWTANIYLWDAEKGAIRTVLHGHSMGVLSVDFSPDGKTLASSSGIYKKQAPGEVRLWTMPDGDEKAKWIGHADSIWCVRFAPDGRTLATASWDQKVIIWETATGKQRETLDNGIAMFDKNPPAALTEKELDEIWNALGDSDGTAAQRAIGRLVRAPDQAAPWLARRLKAEPAAADEQQAKSIQAWIKKLDDDDFDTREKAAEQLAKFGATAGPALQKALDNNPSLEARQRISGLLEKLGKSGSRPEDLRGIRALEALEMIGTEPARELLKGLAEGAPEAALTREAAASCRRLAQRP